MTTLTADQIALLQLVTGHSPGQDGGAAEAGAGGAAGARASGGTGAGAGGGAGGGNGAEAEAEDNVSRIGTPPHELTGIDVHADGDFIPAGGSLQFQAVGEYADGVSEMLTGQVDWSADPAAVVSIDQSGLATGQAKPGTARITARLGAVSGYATVRAAALQGVTLQPDQPVIQGGSSLQMKAQGRYSDGVSRNLGSLVEWTAGPDSVIAIDAKGVAVAKRVTGSGVITATTVRLPGQQFAAQTRVSVITAVLQKVKIRPDSTMVVVGQPIRFAAMGHYSDGREDMDETQALHWSWEPAELLVMEDTVGKRGMAIAAAKEGAVTVTASDPNNPAVSDAVTIQVVPPQVSEAPDPEALRRQDQHDAHEKGLADGKEGRQDHRDELVRKGEPGLGGRMAAYDVGYREGRKAEGAKAVDPHVELMANLTLVELSDAETPEYWLLQDQQGYSNLIKPYLAVREKLKGLLARVDAKNASRDQLGPDVVKEWTQALNDAGDLRQRLALATVLMWDGPIREEKQRLQKLRDQLKTLEAKHRVIEKEAEEWEKDMAIIGTVLMIGDMAELVLDVTEGMAEPESTSSAEIVRKAGIAEAKSQLIEKGIDHMKDYYKNLTLVSQGLASLEELHRQMEARGEDIAGSLKELGRLTQHQEHAEYVRSTAALQGPVP